MGHAQLQGFPLIVQLGHSLAFYGFVANPDGTPRLVTWAMRSAAASALRTKNSLRQLLGQEDDW